MSDLKYIEKMLQTRSAVRLAKVTKKLDESKAKRKVKENDLFALEIDKASRAHITLMMFMMAVKYISEYKFKDENIRTRLLHLM